MKQGYPILHKIENLSRAEYAFHIDPAKGNSLELGLPFNDLYIYTCPEDTDLPINASLSSIKHVNTYITG